MWPLPNRESLSKLGASLLVVSLTFGAETVFFWLVWPIFSDYLTCSSHWCGLHESSVNLPEWKAGPNTGTGEEVEGCILGKRIWGVGQLGWQQGHSPAFQTGVDYTWANKVCWSFVEGLSTGRRMTWEGLGHIMGFGRTKSREWGRPIGRQVIHLLWSAHTQYDSTRFGVTVTFKAICAFKCFAFLWRKE